MAKSFKPQTCRSSVTTRPIDRWQIFNIFELLRLSSGFIAYKQYCWFWMREQYQYKSLDFDSRWEPANKFLTLGLHLCFSKFKVHRVLHRILENLMTSNDLINLKVSLYINYKKKKYSSNIRQRNLLQSKQKKKKNLIRHQNLLQYTKLS